MIFHLPQVDERDPPLLLIDDDDAGAVPHKEWKLLADELMVKAPAWRRWRTFSEYLTGTICIHVDGNPFNFYRKNLVPALRPWKAERQKWT